MLVVRQGEVDRAHVVANEAAEAVGASFRAGSSGQPVSWSIAPLPLTGRQQDQTHAPGRSISLANAVTAEHADLGTAFEQLPEESHERRGIRILWCAGNAA
jgi:hypothetical protein